MQHIPIFYIIFVITNLFVILYLLLFNNYSLCCGRNCYVFSLQISNETIISHSATVIRHTVSLLLAALECGTAFTATTLAFDIMINIASRFDMSGKKRLFNPSYLEDTTTLDDKVFILYNYNAVILLLYVNGFVKSFEMLLEVM